MSGDARISRAWFLAERCPAASEILTFYARLVEFQRRMVNASGASPDRQAQIALVPAFLDWLSREGPHSLAGRASALQRFGADEWNRWFDLAFAVSGEGDESRPADGSALFVAEAILQPWAEQAVGHAQARPGPDDGAGAATAACPACGCPPVVGVLREEGHGARRSLICVRCASEWPYPRVTCLACGEQAHEALPVYNADQFPHIRIEACDRCRRYLKSIDLSKDGRAVPVVDDLASVPLDLWARAEGYVRVRHNLLRT